MKTDVLLNVLEKNKKNSYSKEDSILKEYDEFLLINGIYRGFDIMTFRKKIKGRTDLCKKILEIYNKAQLENERISLVQDLYAIGYNKDLLVEMILEEFDKKEQKSYLWEYGDLLYTIKNYKYLPQYIDIIKNSAFKESRQMIILLVGKCKKQDVIPVLISLVEDETIYGHVIDALSNFEGKEIIQIMDKYKADKIKWMQHCCKYLEMRA